MKKLICFLFSLSLVCCSQIMAQKYNAVDYWKIEHDSVFNILKKRQNAGDTLSISEMESLVKYRLRLEEYFNKMSDTEKSSYFKNRSLWEKQPGTVDKIATPPEAEIYLGQKSAYTNYLVSSGIFGMIYGVNAVYFFRMDGNASTAIPLLTAGASTLIPLLSIKDRKVTNNSLKLSLHGKTLGLFHGMALSLLITGEDTKNEKLLLGLSTVTSIGLGHLGYMLGRDQPWSQGRAALYTFYGTLMPLEGLALTAAFKTEDPRIYGLAFLAGGAGGYIFADRVARWYEFAPGDITSTKALTAISAMLGFGIAADIAENSKGDPSLMLIPAVAAFGGAITSHYWLRDARLTNQQGRNTALATTGGAIMGLGVTSIFNPESITPNYLVPFLTGLSSYALLVHMYKKHNQQQYYKTEKDSKWKLDFMPQNIFINQKLGNIINTNPGRQPLFLPAISASYKF
jgi:hypothetical protein